MNIPDIEEVFHRLEGVRKSGRGWVARCPAHDDRSPSLSVGVGEGGRLLLHCHAGCSYREILGALGLGGNGAGPVASRKARRAETRGGHAAPEWREYLRTLTKVSGTPGEEYLRSRGFDPDNCPRTGFAADFAGAPALVWPLDTPDGKRCGLHGRYVLEHTPKARTLGDLADGAFFLPDVNACREAEEVAVFEAPLDALACHRTTGGAVIALAGTVWRDWFAEFARGKRILLAFDADKAGEEAVSEWNRKLSDAGFSQVLRLRPPEGCKDFAEALQRFGKDGLRERMPGPERLAAPNALRVVTVASINARKLAWLWQGRLAAGELTEICGDPGLGKSLLALDIAARLSCGAPWPDGTRPPGAVRCLVLSAEDDPATTIRPRLEAAGADLAQVFLLPLDEWLTTADAGRLADAVRRENVGLVIFDPLPAFIAEVVDTHRDAAVRAAMMPMVRMARETGCAVLSVRHLNKAQGAAPIYRPGGSVALSALVRLSFAVARDPNDRRRRVLVTLKANVAAEPPSLAFELVPADDVARVSWCGVRQDLTAEALFAGKPAPPAGEEAVTFLLDVLRDGPKPASEVATAARDAGISLRTLHRARAELGVRTFQRERQWFLALPRPEGASDCQAANKIGSLKSEGMPGEGVVDAELF